MDLSESVLGHSTATWIKERATIPLLKIGSDTFTKSILSGVSCFNWNAASNLSNLLKDLGVKNTRDLFDRVHPRELALPRMGGVSIAVLGAAFEAKGLGGDKPLTSWYRLHMLKESANDTSIKPVQFASLKRQDQQAAREESAAKSKRKRARRAQAHRLRVTRFEARA
jgi:hypothetical protein